MSEDLQDEVTSINSIYGDDTLSSLEESSHLYTLSLPSQPNISIRIDFPPSYPDVPPSVLGTQHVGSETAKGEGTHVVELVREVLAEIYVPGSPCVFDLIEESGQRLQQHGLDQSSKDEESQASSQAAINHGQQFDDDEDDPEMTFSDIRRQEDSDDFGLSDTPPPWTLSDAFTEKKSVFLARAAPVTSVSEAKSYLAHLLTTDKKAAKATHNITAWRIRGENGVQYQDCDDDGEDAAGGRLLHLLELMGVWNVMVVVSRWYGGIKLGPDRFRLINQSGRDAIVKAGFVAAQEDGKESGKKKGKR